MAGFNYWTGIRVAHANSRRELEADLTQFTGTVNSLLEDQQSTLASLIRSESLRSFAQAQSSSLSPHNDVMPPAEVRLELASVLNRHNHFSSVAYFDQNRREVFLSEPGPNGLVIRNKDFLPGLRPDDLVWTGSAFEQLRAPVSLNSLRSSLKISAPVVARDSGPPIGAVVADLSLDSILSEAARAWRVKEPSRVASDSVDAPRTIVAVDSAGIVLYHPNQALHHQPIGKSLPDLAPLTAQMLSGQTGWQIFKAGKNEFSAAYTFIPPLNLSVAVIDEYPDALSSIYRAGIVEVIFAIVLGFLAAFLLARFWEQRTSGIDRVTKGVAAIAGGDLNYRIDAHSTDAIRPLSEDLNRMTAQLREQIAREAEARQFQSFVRLSAMLTHDLKNAIEALSLIVGNMERHFDNEEFRADAMKSLNLATKNLRSLVDRLANPVNTLSGEYKRPQPVDLVPLLTRVISLTAGQASGTHKIETRLPASVFALADGARIEKVMENLILNGLEAMSGKNGILTIEAGPDDAGTVFFSVTDTGVGMSPDFIKNQLYRPFATTKKRGVGLGLYTCREFVRANGGTIEVDSREGVGTTFRVVLPSATIERTV